MAASVVVTAVLAAASVGAEIELKAMAVAVPDAAVALSVNVDEDIERYGAVVEGVADMALEMSSKPVGAVVPMPILPL